MNVRWGWERKRRPPVGLAILLLAALLALLSWQDTLAQMALGAFSTGESEEGTRIVAVQPAPNSHVVAADTHVAATANRAVSRGSISTATFSVHAGFGGRMAGSFLLGRRLQDSAPGFDTVIFHPSRNFLPGELVQASATRAMIVGGVPLEQPRVWQFRIAPLAGTGTFTNTGQSLGTSESIAAALGDLDDDGDVDAFVANDLEPDMVWFNEGGGYFIDSGQRLGNFYSTDVDLGDLDGDGDLDAFVVNAGQPNVVWINNGGYFGDSGQRLGGNRWSWGVALGDLDADGDLDAFVANQFRQPNEVWWNDGDGVFSDSGQRIGRVSSFDAALGDLDADGDLDAFVANWDDLGSPNQVWFNDGNGFFVDSGQQLGESPSYAVAVGDLDDDGDVDAFVANASKRPDTVWRNDGSGVFRDTGQLLGAGQSESLALGDVDDDSDLDAIVTNVLGPNKVWLNNGGGGFIDSEQALGDAYSLSVALGDLDNDGDLDIFFGNGNDQADEVWRNLNCVVENLLAGNDSGDALSLLRHFRDEALMAQPATQHWVERYYRHSPEVIRILLLDAGLRARATQTLRSFLPALQGLVGDQPQRALALTDLTDYDRRQADALLRELGERGGAELRAATEELRGLLALFEGRTVEAAWQLIAAGL